MAEPVGFVGRDAELSRLLQALACNARLVLVVGDAGVGKSRFVAEGMLRRAAAAGMLVLRGECLPVARTLPLLPLVSALGDLAGRNEGSLMAAALEAAPGFVRAEITRLLPQLGAGSEPETSGPDGTWRRERLFAGVAEVLAAVAQQAPVGLLVEDVHWADSDTLDCLTLLSRTGRPGRVTVVVTCRTDEAPLPAHVIDWLAQVRGAADTQEIAVPPMSLAEVGQLAVDMAGEPVPPRVVDELYRRAEGNPFFTEQLVAAALASPAESGLDVPPALPGRLAALLAGRAARCAGDARAVLAGLAVAGRPLAEALLSAVTGLQLAAVRGGLRELAASRLLADETVAGAFRPRHALLAEAVAASLLPGERTALHERIARTLTATGSQALAAEAAGHWQAAGRSAGELAARVAAAEAAEAMFGYADAAGHWQRAIELSQEQPVAAGAGLDLPRLYRRAVDALRRGGYSARASELAEEAYSQFAGHPDPATAAVACHRAGMCRGVSWIAAGLPLIEQSLRLFEQAPISADYAQALYDYIVALHADNPESNEAAANRALEIAEAVGATSLIPVILVWRGLQKCFRGQIDEGLAILERGRALAQAAGDGPALTWLALVECGTLGKLARFGAAADIGLRGLETVRQAGLTYSGHGCVLAGNTAEALLALGRTADAGAVIDPLTTAAPDRDHVIAQMSRAEIDLLHGDIEAAARRRQQLKEQHRSFGVADNEREWAQRGAELACWAGRPGEALTEVRLVLPKLETPGLAIFCGWLLCAGMRACADLAEQARARLDQQAGSAAVAAADGLDLWVDRMAGAPFADHPLVGTIPAERANWEAERSRLIGPSDPQAWGSAAKAWQDLSFPHRAGYALWRQAQAQLDRGQPAIAAAATLRAAAVAADGHAPLLAQIRLLAGRARIALPAEPEIPEEKAPDTRAPYGLTDRELAVLRLLATGRTNAQIGAELYISPKTAGVHVTSILRKLGVSGRVQAAALAERAGLLEPPVS
ncbi:MAG: helix-turn-helix transcriptional regulator [Streptosporangiaceae bacterium]